MRGPGRDHPGQKEGSANRTLRNSSKNLGAEGNVRLGKTGSQPAPRLGVASSQADSLPH